MTAHPKPTSDNAELLFYVDGDRCVWKRSVKTKNADGTISMTLGFPVCVVDEWADPEMVAAALDFAERRSGNAELLAHYEAKIARLAKVNGQLLNALEGISNDLDAHKSAIISTEQKHELLAIAEETARAALAAAKEAAQ